mgnify:FL=1
MRDYREYKLSWKERAGAVLVGALGAGAMVFLFFPTLVVTGGCALVGGILGPCFLKKKRLEQTRRQLTMEFQACLGMLLPVLRTGRSLEGAIQAVSEDLNAEELPCMRRELQSMQNGLMLGMPLEELFLDLGHRSGVEDIQDFAELLALRKRSKGDLTEAAEYTIRILSEKMEAEEELRTLLAQRRLEQRVMNVMPFLILGLLLMMSPDYLRPLYESISGVLIRLSCLLLMGLSVILSKRIGSIRM